jgi:hypothetical protein
MYINFNLTDEERKQIMEMHKSHGYKKLINEDDSQMAVLQQVTNDFNEKMDEDLTPEELQDVACANPDTMELPSDIGNEEKQKVDEFKAKLKTAKIPELMQVKRQLKELRRQSKQQQNEQAGAMVTLLGVTMPQAFALVIGGLLLIMVLNILLSLTGFHLVKTITSWCTGRQTTGYGFRFGRN